MLTQTITRYSAPAKRHEKDKPRFVGGSPEHRRYIFTNTLAKSIKKWEHGDTIRLRRGNQLGYVIDIITDFDQVEWDGYKCKFIEVWTAGSQESKFVHPSDIIG